MRVIRWGEWSVLLKALLKCDDTSLACIRDNLRRRGSTSSPQSSILLLTVPKSPLPTGKPCSTHTEGLHTDIWQKLRREQNVLRCSGTPRISGKLFTGLSVGRTAALCIIVIQTGRQTHTHTPATPWAHSPVQPCGEKKKYDGADAEASPRSSFAVPSSLYPCFYSQEWCPCRAVLSCFGVNPTGCSVHSALQGRRGLTSPRQRLNRGQ